MIQIDFLDMGFRTLGIVCLICLWVALIRIDFVGMLSMFGIVCLICLWVVVFGIRC